MRHLSLPLAFALALAACNGPQAPPPLGEVVSHVELNCRDGIDQDADGDADCADPECATDPFCTTCGNGVIDPPEQCDDGGTAPGDGCSSACRTETGFVCRFPGEPCVANLCEVAAVGTSRFLRGNYVEIGLNQNGAFGTYTDAAPEGWHSRSDQEAGEIGFVADPAGTDWTDFHGDYFTPGDPEEGWALDVGGTIYNNNRSSLSLEIPGALGTAECLPRVCGSRSGARVTWSSSAPVGGVDVTQTYTIVDGGAFILVDVTLTNTTETELVDVYFMRNVDPDNDITRHNDYTTLNTIVSQPDGTTDLASVSASQDLNGIQSSMSLITRDPRARVTWGGFNNRVPQDVWHGTGGLVQTGQIFEDIAISVAYRVTIPANDSTSFRYAYNLEADTTDVLTCVELDLDGDGVPDADDGDPNDPTVCRDVDADTCDDCSGGFDNPFGDGPDFDGDGACDAGDLDDDRDGVPDDQDDDDLDPNACRDLDEDLCDDCALTGADESGGDPANDGPDAKGDGLCDTGDTDDDNDGVPDGADVDPLDPDVCRDLDDDTCDDCLNTGADGSGGAPADDGPDAEGDGLCDAGDPDDDNDTIADTAETGDTDGDGTPDNGDLDSDGDGISDLDEAGDGDVGTGPADTDGDGTPDFQDLDSDGDGISDADEAGDADGDTPPVDTDVDGLPDFQDPDADGDGIPDRDEGGDGDPSTPPADTDGDSVPDYRDEDSDGDGTDDNRDNCPLINDPRQDDLDNDGNGDPCDADRFGVSGGGCSTGGGGSGGALVLVMLAGAVALRRRRGRAGLALAGLIGLCGVGALAPRAAHAQQPSLTTDVPVERMRWSAGQDAILDVESASVLPSLALNGALGFTFAKNPLTIYAIDSNGDRNRVAAPVANRASAELVAAVGIADLLEIGFAMPFVLSQTSESGDLMLPASSSAGVGDVRVLAKIALLTQRRVGFDLAAMANVGFPTATSDSYLGEAAPVAEPGVAISRRFGALRASTNLAYRLRERTESIALVVDDELMLSAGVGYRVGGGDSPAFEVDGAIAIATSADEPFGKFDRNYVEAKVGGSFAPTRTVAVLAGGGAGLAEGFGSPDWRVFAGVRFAFAVLEQFGSDDSDEVRVHKVDVTEHGSIAKAAEVKPPAPTDDDGDGLFGGDDTCPTQAETKNGYLDDDGCPDTPPDRDADGSYDRDDACPDAAEDVDGFQDTDFCPDLDDDGDTIADQDDKCPRVAGVAATGGCPDPDTDGDTVVDRLDNCPQEAGKPENAGCKAKQLVRITADQIEILDVVHFRTDRADIRSKSFKLLDNVARVLVAHPELVVRVEGHTDNEGDDAHNKDLSQRRAASVVAYLVKKKVEAARLTPVGFGEEAPVQSNDTRKGRAANRRVVFAIVPATVEAPPAVMPATPATAPATP